MIALLAACASAPLDLQVAVEFPDPSVGGAIWLHITTSESTSVRVAIHDGVRDREVEFAEEADARSVPILGFYPGSTAILEVTADAGDRVAVRWVEVTLPVLPATFPVVEVLALAPDDVEPGWTLLDIKVPNSTVGYLVVLDEAGDPTWWQETDPEVGDVRLEPDGFLWLLTSGAAQKRDWFGRVVASWGASTVNLNHEIFPIEGGFLSIDPLSVSVDAYPESSSAPTELAPADIEGGHIVDVGLDDEIRRQWVLAELLDTSRIGFDGHDAIPAGFDWAHVNGVVPDGDGIVVSVRHQDAIVRIDGAGALDWILGTPSGWTSPWADRLLAPVGEVVWPYHQHAPEVAADGTIVVFDNHRFGYNPYEAEVAQAPSAAAGFTVDPVARTVRAAFRFETTSTGPLYSAALGDADVQPVTGNVLADFGFLDAENDVVHADLGWGRKAVRLVEFAPDGRVVLDVRLRSDLAAEPEGWQTYRAERIATPWPAAGVDAGRWLR